MSRIEPRAATPRACNAGRPAWTRAEIRCAIRRTFPRTAATALCIAWHESRLDPRAVGNAGERGIFQIHPVHRAWLGGRWARMFDPVENARAARDLHRTSGYSWRPWSTAGRC
jgi:soluble lytic murein transglycosylase-like protein